MFKLNDNNYLQDNKFVNEVHGKGDVSVAESGYEATSAQYHNCIKTFTELMWPLKEP